MQAMIVMPCLNEEAFVSAACASLGFGVGAGVQETTAKLVLVDNGSEDHTADIMREVCRHAPPGAVILVEEPERGYAPPRHAGVLAAAQWARSHGVSADDVLILQADADTLYQSGYAAAMVMAADSWPGNVMLEGCALFEESFLAQHQGYMALCQEADNAVAELVAPFEDDVIVDDKLAAFRLADYFRWGGHRREHLPGGDELYAETTRLYLRARLGGASREKVLDALAYPSRRKVVVDPSQYFSTSGFPREATWRTIWAQRYSGPNVLNEFTPLGLGSWVPWLMKIRRSHSIGMFGVLPACVALLRGSDLPEPTQLSDVAIRCVGSLAKDAVANSPALLLAPILSAIDDHGDELVSLAHR